jgi:hypothetical protein
MWTGTARRARRHRHRPGGRARTRRARGPAALPGGRLTSGRIFQYPGDFLTGDRQPRDLLFRPGQLPRKLPDPAAQTVRLGPGRRLPPPEFLDQRPQRGLLPLPTTVEDHIADQPEIRQNRKSKVPSEELHPLRLEGQAGNVRAATDGDGLGRRSRMLV